MRRQANCLTEGGALLAEAEEGASPLPFRFRITDFDMSCSAAEEQFGFFGTPSTMVTRPE